MKNRLFLFMLVLASATTFPVRSQGASTEKPNVIFIFTDDQGWGDLGVYGHPDIKTPHLDKLAHDGLLLTQFYVGAPVCSPSRATLLTGRFAPETGIHYAIGGPGGDQYNSTQLLDPELPNIYKTFSKNGYLVGHFGKWHLGTVNAPPRSAYGVDETEQTGGPNSGPGRIPNKFGKIPTNANKSEVVTDYGVDFIRRNRDETFFLSLWLQDPHAVLDPTEEQMKPYLEYTHPAVIDHYRSSQTIYYSIISSIDKAVGRIIQTVDSLGLRENTIIIFSSDNGPSPLWSQATGTAGSGLAGPFRGVKSSLYEGGIRVPFIISWPNTIPAGRVDGQSVVGAVDMYPSLVRLARLPDELPSSLDGEDRSRVFLGKSTIRTKPMMWEHRFTNWGTSINDSPRLAIRDDGWKLLMNPDRSRVELYNLVEDVNETENRARYEKKIVKDLENKLMSWWKSEVPDIENAPAYAGQIKWQMPK